MTALPINWKPIAGRTLEAALNRALALDPDTREQLRALDGQRIALHLETPPLAVQVCVDGERLVVDAHGRGVVIEQGSDDRAPLPR